MEVTPRSRLGIRLQNIAFVVLFLAVMGLLGWLTHTYNIQADWTAGNRNTLSEASRKLLARIEGPIEISAYARQTEGLRKRITDLIDRYRRASRRIELEFVNPDTAPQRVRELGITTDGTLMVAYQGRTEKVTDLTEQALTNAIQRLTRGGERKVLFLTGHGERKPKGEANHDLGTFGRELERTGIRVGTLNLAKTTAIPEDTAVLVVAGPQVDLLAPELRVIRDHLEAGGHLLWLTDPGARHGMGEIAEALGVEVLPGTVVDPTSRLFGINDPALILVAEYPSHALTQDFETVTLFPRAAGLQSSGETWEADAFLRSLPRSWAESGALQGELRYDPDSRDVEGPVTLGLALTRERARDESPQARAADAEAAEAESTAPEQRVVVIGDGDFLSNAYVGNGGNLDLGLNIVNWLTRDEAFIAIHPKAAPDTRLELSRGASITIGFGFLAVIPLGLLAAGLAIWWRRRRR